MGLELQNCSGRGPGERVREWERALEPSLGSKGVRHPLNGVSLVGNVHEGHTRDFTDTTAEVAIAGGDNVDSIGGNSFDDAVVCVGSFVGARESAEARVLGNTKGHAVLEAELF